jgi:putative SOS response-associated peptidase YedK
MPVILRPNDYDLWLDPGLNNAKELSSLLLPFDASAMRRYAVSRRVNSVKNDDAGCALPLDVAAAGA